MRIRRIGRNELAAIQVALALTDAQEEYHAFDRDRQRREAIRAEDPVLAGQARRAVLGVEPGEPESPLGRWSPQATAEESGYHGYLYRVLTAQGKDAPGGARSYVEERPDDRGLRARRVAGEVRRHRRDDVHRRQGRQSSRRRTSVPDTDARRGR